MCGITGFITAGDHFSRVEMKQFSATMSDAIIRLLPGVMGSDASAEEERFANGLLEYPHYTRPATWQGLEIPDILTSGDHGKIAQWREQKAKEITQKRRPDLWAKHLPTKK